MTLDEDIDVNTSARHLTAGWRVYRYGQWHTIESVHQSIGRDGTWIVLRTDAGRCFHVNPQILVAAEAPQ